MFVIVVMGEVEKKTGVFDVWLFIKHDSNLYGAHKLKLPYHGSGEAAISCFSLLNLLVTDRLHLFPPQKLPLQN